MTAGGSGNVIEGNYIGTDVTGTVALGGNTAIQIETANNTVGGTVAGAGNLVSGNSSSGVIFYGSAATGNTVVGNFIGTNAAGTAPLSNHGDGIEILNGASGNTIGGTSAGARNVVSGNLGIGVNIFNSASGNSVSGNYIGIDAAGTAPWPTASLA